MNDQGQAGRSTVERVVLDGVERAIIMRVDHAPAATEFLTGPDDQLQLGNVVYPRGGSVPRHYHEPVARRLVGMAEAIVVRSGLCVVMFFDGEELFASRYLETGDVLVIHADAPGLRIGHGFQMIEDTVLLEIKLGPYGGPSEKVRF